MIPLQTLELLQKKISSADSLLSITKTMKALAAANMGQYERAVESLEDYYRTVRLGLQVVINQLDSGGEHELKWVGSRSRTAQSQTVSILVGTDHGFVGRFNDEIVAYGLDMLRQSEADPENHTIFCIGEQVYSRVEQTGKYVSTFFPGPNSLVEVNSLVEKILLEIDKLHTKRPLGAVYLFYQKPLSGTGYAQKMETVIPVELDTIRRGQVKWPSHNIPMFTMDPEALFAALIQQHIFVTLYGAIVFSMAAENASRLISMQAAGKNIEELLEVIKAEFRQNRQNAITSEILDIASGFSALEE